MSQTNIKQGPFRILTNENLTGKEDRLVVMGSFDDEDNRPAVFLPKGLSDYALYVLLDGGAAETNVTVQPLESGRQVRLKLSGTCSPGDVLVLAPITPETAGMVRVLPGSPGTYRGLAIAEEAGSNGQLVLCRPALIGNITVSA